MLRYKNHRFHYGKVSFQIPEGYFIDTAPELISDNFLHLYAPDMSFFIDIHVYTESKDSTTELSSVLRDMKHTLVHPVSIISINGLTTRFIYRLLLVCPIRSSNSRIVLGSVTSSNVLATKVNVARVFQLETDLRQVLTYLGQISCHNGCPRMRRL